MDLVLVLGLGIVAMGCQHISLDDEPPAAIRRVREEIPRGLPTRFEAPLADLLAAEVPPPMPGTGGSGDSESSDEPEAITGTEYASSAAYAVEGVDALRRGHRDRVIKLIRAIAQAVGEPPSGFAELDVTEDQADLAIALLLADLDALEFEGESQYRPNMAYARGSVADELEAGEVPLGWYARGALEQCADRGGEGGHACASQLRRLRHLQLRNPACADTWAPPPAAPSSDRFTMDVRNAPFFAAERRRLAEAFERRFAQEGQLRLLDSTPWPDEEGCAWVSRDHEQASYRADVIVDCAGRECLIYGAASWMQEATRPSSVYRRARQPIYAPLTDEAVAAYVDAYDGRFIFGTCGTGWRRRTGWRVLRATDTIAAEALREELEACEVDPDEMISVVAALDARGHVGRIEWRAEGAYLRPETVDCLDHLAPNASAGEETSRALIVAGAGVGRAPRGSPRPLPPTVSDLVRECLREGESESMDLCVEADAGGDIVRIEASRARSWEAPIPRVLSPRSTLSVLTAETLECVRETLRATPICSETGALFVSRPTQR